jgi:hypothetical protein
VLGRFLSADTIVPSPGNPQALNRYAYTQNNPLKYTDPSGHFIAPIIGVALIAAAVVAGAIEARQVSNYAQEHNMGFWEAFASKDLTLDQQEMVRGAADAFATTVTLGGAAMLGGGQSIQQLGQALNNPQIFGAGLEAQAATQWLMGAVPSASKAVDAVARGHGARPDAKMIKVGPNSSVSFWNQDGETIYDYMGRSIEENVAGPPMEVVGPGGQVHNYTLMPNDPDYGPPLEYSLNPVGQVIEAKRQPLTLEQILGQFPEGVDLRWAACHSCPK